MKRFPGLNHIIRDGHECIAHDSDLTEAERAEIEQRRRSPEARKRFGIELRRIRRIQDAPAKAVMKAYSDPNCSPEERARLMQACTEAHQKLLAETLRLQEKWNTKGI